MNLWTSLSLPLLIPPVSLCSLSLSLSLLLHIPLERMTEGRAQQSIHLLNLSGGDSTDKGGCERERVRESVCKGGAMKSSPCFMGKCLTGRIVCLQCLSEREGLHANIALPMPCEKAVEKYETDTKNTW